MREVLPGTGGSTEVSSAERFRMPPALGVHAELRRNASEPTLTSPSAEEGKVCSCVAVRMRPVLRMKRAGLCSVFADRGLQASVGVVQVLHSERRAGGVWLVRTIHPAGTPVAVRR